MNVAEFAIDANDLRREFATAAGPVAALRGLHMQIRRGERVAVIGRSGAGKSTLLNLIGALDLGYTGQLRVFGQDLQALKDRQLSQFRNRQIGFVFQSFNLLTNLNVLENVLLPGQLGSPMPEVELRQRAVQLLATLGLADRAQQNTQQMSGGERQRVAIARALLLRPPLLVCDEPTGSLDADTAEQILSVLFELSGQSQATLVLVTHDASIAQRCDRVLTLDAGQMAEQPRGGPGSMAVAP